MGGWVGCCSLVLGVFGLFARGFDTYGTSNNPLSKIDTKLRMMISDLSWGISGVSILSGGISEGPADLLRGIG